LFLKLPAAWIAGVKLLQLSDERSEVGIRYKWLNTNPFQSIYFAVLCMAGEFASGILAMQHVFGAKPAISILVVGLEAGFFKKARGRIVFRCEEGAAIAAAIEKARKTGEGVAITVVSEGFDEAGDIVARFNVTWSFKVKSE
jgi:hypothetical protein